jgi:serine/threonine-protein kinase RsbW
MPAERMPRNTERSARSSRPEAQIFHHSFPADPISVRDALRAAMARFLRLMTPDEAGTLELILAEVLNNIVEHSYGDSGTGTVTLSIVRDRRGLSCSVSDDGVPLPEGCLRKVLPDDPGRPHPDTLPEGGFGWCLIHDLAQDLGYSRQDDRNLLAVRLPLCAEVQSA